MTGFLHAVETMGTLDGPGVRFVAFLQGCPLRCSCCHNPDSQPLPHQSVTCQEITPQALLEQILRCKPFFGAHGGVTVSGGEPLLQQPFVTELFRLCKAQDIHTCLDTSGCVQNQYTPALLAVTDLVLLDIKYTHAQAYDSFVGCAYDAVLDFLEILQIVEIPVWLRQVYIPSKNDTPENLQRLATLATQHSCVKKVELLAFRRLCIEKYESMGIPFPFAHIPEPLPETVAKAQAQLNALMV